MTKRKYKKKNLNYKKSEDRIFWKGIHRTRKITTILVIVGIISAIVGVSWLIIRI